MPPEAAPELGNSTARAWRPRPAPAPTVRSRSPLAERKLPELGRRITKLDESGPAAGKIAQFVIEDQRTVHVAMSAHRRRRALSSDSNRRQVRVARPFVEHAASYRRRAPRSARNANGRRSGRSQSASHHHRREGQPGCARLVVELHAHGQFKVSSGTSSLRQAKRTAADAGARSRNVNPPGTLSPLAHRRNDPIVEDQERRSSANDPSTRYSAA